MSILVIGAEEKKSIARLMKHAEENVVTLDRVMRMFDGTEKSVGDDPNYVVELPRGYRVVFSYEIQPHDRKARHISVSLTGSPKPDSCPSPAAVDMILEEFGFSGRTSPAEVESGKILVWLEEEINAVNCLELMLN